MARPRVPTVYAFRQIILRGACVALSLATFIASLYATTKYGYGKAVSGAFAAVRFMFTVAGRLHESRTVL